MNRTRRLTTVYVAGLFIGSPPMPVAAADVYRVGMLGLGGGGGGGDAVPAAFRDRLASLGYAEGRNLIIESRSADGHSERLPALAAELVRLNVDVIVTITTPAALAAKAATSTIPIVMSGSASPVELGLVASLARPGGNITGLTNSMGGVTVKQLQLLKEAAPRIARVAVLMTSFSFEANSLADMQAASAALGVTVIPFKVESPTEIGLDALGKLRADALYVFPNSINIGHAKAILGFAAENRLPAMYGDRRFVEDGGLMSYWTDWIELRRHTADFVDRILKGAKPADLPVENPTRFELVINLKTAKALGLTVPQAVLLRANEVIQ